MIFEETTMPVDGEDVLEASDSASHPARSAIKRGVEGSSAAPAEGGRISSRFAYRFLKRAFDIVFSLVVIAALLVPSLLLCLAIRLESPGSPIYSQKRVGRGGRLIRVLKIRTMVSDADDVSKHLTSEQLDQWEKERKVEDDPRVTRVGRILRATSLDEVPQFLNVLKGDLSVIGPRPVTRDELAWFGDDVEEYLSVPMGITGLWQATTRNDTTFESGERQRIELEYVRNAGFAMDARCFLGTFGAMFGKRSGR